MYDEELPTLHFTNEAALHVMAFIANSALRWCVTNEVENGALAVTPVRPVGALSEGERYLWLLLDDTRNGILQGLAWKADPANARAAVELVAGMLGVSFTEVTA